MTDLPKRKKNRLKDYDYSSNGAYFVTICTKDRVIIFKPAPAKKYFILQIFVLY